METVNRALDSASHTIWGETHPQHQQQQQQHGEEPLSGVQGQGKPTDPYDGGNRDVQPGAPSTQSPTASQEPGLTDPIGHSSEAPSPAISQDVDPQGGAVPRPGTSGNGFASTGLASGVPEKPGVEADPVQNDASALSSRFGNQANTTDVPEGEQRTAMGNNPPGPETGTDQSTTTPTTATAGDAAAGAGGIGGGTAAAGSTAEQAQGQQQYGAEQRAESGAGTEQPEKVDCAEPSTSSGEGGHARQQVSEEALKGPQAPPPREKYEFEKEMEGKPTNKGGGGGGQSQPQGQAKGTQGGGHHHGKAMEKMKEKLGRAAKAGTHR